MEDMKESGVYKSQGLVKVNVVGSCVNVLRVSEATEGRHYNMKYSDTSVCTSETLTIVEIAGRLFGFHTQC